MPDQPITHPGELCQSGERAVRLALELGRAQERIRHLEDVLYGQPERTPEPAVQP